MRAALDINIPNYASAVVTTEEIVGSIAFPLTLQPRLMRNRTVTYLAQATFSALADPTRRAVLELLRQGPQPAGRIARAFPVSRPAISKHLRRLRNARLVQERREGRQHFYRPNAEPLRMVDSWIGHYRAFWGANLAALKSFIEGESSTLTVETKRKKKQKPKENSDECHARRS